jgi:hypothetical protein
MALGALVAVMDFEGVAEDEFHDWYDKEHIPEREGIPGFLSIQRWIGHWLEGGNDRLEPAADHTLSLAMYDLERTEVLSEPPYTALGRSPWAERIIARCSRFERYVAEQVAPGDIVSPGGAAALFIVAMNVEDDYDEEFNRWYAEEHLPGMSAVPGIMAARRYKTLPGHGTQRYFAVYHAEHPDALGGPEWREAGETPWTHRMREHMYDRERSIYAPYVPAR